MGHVMSETEFQGRKHRLSEIRENQNSYDLQISESERVSIDRASARENEEVELRKPVKGASLNKKRKLTHINT